MLRISAKMEQDDDYEVGDIYSFKVTINNPVELHGDGDGVFHSVAALAATLLRQGVVDQEEATQMAADRRGGTLCRILANKGYDGMHYINNVEDAGSVSLIVFDGSQSAYTGERTDFTRDEAIDLGWL